MHRPESFNTMKKAKLDNKAKMREMSKQNVNKGKKT